MYIAITFNWYCPMLHFVNTLHVIPFLISETVEINQIQYVCSQMRPCPEGTLTGQVCATNERTYPSLCKLIKYKCKSGDAVNFRKSGSCSDRTGESIVFYICDALQ